MKKLLLIVSLLLVVMGQTASAAKTEKITVIPALPINGLDTKGLDSVANILKEPLRASGLFSVITNRELADAAEMGIDPETLRTNLTIQISTSTEMLILELTNKGSKVLNSIKLPLSALNNENQLITALTQLLPILQASATCQSWQDHITTDMTLPMQEAMDELAYRLLDCHLVSASERQSPYLKYVNQKTQGAVIGLLSAGFSSLVFAGAGWAWVAGLPSDAGGYVVGGVFSAVAVATLAAGIPLAVKYHRGKEERQALESKQADLQLTPVFSPSYNGLQLALTW